MERYWIDKDSKVVVRAWSGKEYKTINPHTHIFEKHWSYYCPICNFIPHLCANKDEAEHDVNVHECCAGGEHRCVIEYRHHELICLEFKEEFIEDLGVWVQKQEYYVN